MDDTATISPRLSAHQAIMDAITARQTWARRITTYYQMRRKGLPRENSPWPGAADLHLPIIDDVITGKAPFYASQLFGSERIANFVPVGDSGLPAQSEAAGKLAELFDDEVKMGSNLFHQLLIANDYMMEAGRGVLMARWEEDRGLVFEAVAPLNFVVPRHTANLQEAPWVCRIVTLSCETYRALPGYNQEALGLIKGAGTSDGASDADKRIRELGEGMSWGKDDEVILWERYTKERTPEGGTKVTVSTFCPTHPLLKVKDDYILPDCHEVSEKGAAVTHYPFVDLPNELIEGGFYASRGDAEKLAAFELWATRQWNAKGDHLSISTKPVFKGGREGNLANFRFTPGAVLEGDIEPLKFPSPPYDIDAEIAQTRANAEKRSRLPDFGIGGRGNLSGNKTATEVNAMSQMVNAGVDLMANIYRLQITALLRQAWALLCQRKPARVATALGGAVLAPQGLVRAFRVNVGGSVDSWNKSLQHQRAATLWAAFKNDPLINQVELRKLFLESLDPRLIDRLLVDPKIKGSDEAEDEAMEILLMLNGFPAVPTEAEDHAGRALLITQKMQAEALKAAQGQGAPPDPRAVQLLTEHRQLHLDMLRQRDPQAYAQAVAGLKQLEAQTAQALASVAQPQPQAPTPFPAPA